MLPLLLLLTSHCSPPASAQNTPSHAPAPPTVLSTATAALTNTTLALAPTTHPDLLCPAWRASNPWGLPADYAIATTTSPWDTVRAR